MLPFRTTRAASPFLALILILAITLANAYPYLPPKQYAPDVGDSFIIRGACPPPATEVFDDGWANHRSFSFLSRVGGDTNGTVSCPPGSLLLGFSYEECFAVVGAVNGPTSLRTVLRCAPSTNFELSGNTTIQNYGLCSDLAGGVKTAPLSEATVGNEALKLLGNASCPNLLYAITGVGIQSCTRMVGSTPVAGLQWIVNCAPLLQPTSHSPANITMATCDNSGQGWGNGTFFPLRTLANMNQAYCAKGAHYLSGFSLTSCNGSTTPSGVPTLALQLNLTCNTLTMTVAWRLDHRCGGNWTAPDGTGAAICDSASDTPCCAQYNVTTYEHPYRNITYDTLLGAVNQTNFNNLVALRAAYMRVNWTIPSSFLDTLPAGTSRADAGVAYYSPKQLNVTLNVTLGPYWNNSNCTISNYNTSDCLWDTEFWAKVRMDTPTWGMCVPKTSQCGVIPPLQSFDYTTTPLLWFPRCTRCTRNVNISECSLGINAARIMPEQNCIESVGPNPCYDKPSACTPLVSQSLTESNYSSLLAVSGVIYYPQPLANRMRSVNLRTGVVTQELGDSYSSVTGMVYNPLIQTMYVAQNGTLLHVSVGDGFVIGSLPLMGDIPVGDMVFDGYNVLYATQAGTVVSVGVSSPFTRVVTQVTGRTTSSGNVADFLVGLMWEQRPTTLVAVAHNGLYRIGYPLTSALPVFLGGANLNITCATYDRNGIYFVASQWLQGVAILDSGLIIRGFVSTGNTVTSMALSSDGSITTLSSDGDIDTFRTVWTPSDETRLTGITTTAGAYNPSFAGTTLSYTVTTSLNFLILTTTLTVAAPLDGWSTVYWRINGQLYAQIPLNYPTLGPIPLSMSSNDIHIQVISSSGNVQKVTSLTITRYLTSLQSFSYSLSTCDLSTDCGTCHSKGCYWCPLNMKCQSSGGGCGSAVSWAWSPGQGCSWGGNTFATPSNVFDIQGPQTNYADNGDHDRIDLWKIWSPNSMFRCPGNQMWVMNEFPSDNANKRLKVKASCVPSVYHDTSNTYTVSGGCSSYNLGGDTSNGGQGWYPMSVLTEMPRPQCNQNDAMVGLAWNTCGSSLGIVLTCAKLYSELITLASQGWSMGTQDASEITSSGNIMNTGDDNAYMDHWRGSGTGCGIGAASQHWGYDSGSDSATPWKRCLTAPVDSRSWTCPAIGAPPTVHITTNYLSYGTNNDAGPSAVQAYAVMNCDAGYGAVTYSGANTPGSFEIAMALARCQTPVESPASHFSMGYSQMNCQACPIGMFSSSSTQYTCQWCPNGFFTENIAQTACQSCTTANRCDNCHVCAPDGTCPMAPNKCQINGACLPSVLNFDSRGLPLLTDSAYLSNYTANKGCLFCDAKRFNQGYTYAPDFTLAPQQHACYDSSFCYRGKRILGPTLCSECQKCDLVGNELNGCQFLNSFHCHTNAVNKTCGCSIGGKCWPLDAVNPANPCQMASVRNTDIHDLTPRCTGDWVNDDSLNCDDPHACSFNRQCSAGTCIFTPNPPPAPCAKNVTCYGNAGGGYMNYTTWTQAELNFQPIVCAHADLMADACALDKVCLGDAVACPPTKSRTVPTLRTTAALMVGFLDASDVVTTKWGSLVPDSLRPLGVRDGGFLSLGFTGLSVPCGGISYTIRLTSDASLMQPGGCFLNPKIVFDTMSTVPTQSPISGDPLVRAVTPDRVTTWNQTLTVPYAHNQQLFALIQAQNTDGDVNYFCAQTRVDLTPPVAGTLLLPSTLSNNGKLYAPSGSTLSASWSGQADPESQLYSYTMLLLRRSDGQKLFNSTLLASSATRSVTMTFPTQPAGTIVDAVLLVTNGARVSSNVTLTVVLDSTPAVFASVSGMQLLDCHPQGWWDRSVSATLPTPPERLFQSNASTLQVCWPAALPSDPESGVMGLAYTIEYRSAMDSAVAIATWTPAVTLTSLPASQLTSASLMFGLTMSDSFIYRVGVRVQNGAGLWSPLVYSPGVWIAITPPSPGQVRVVDAATYSLTAQQLYTVTAVRYVSSPSQILINFGSYSDSQQRLIAWQAGSVALLQYEAAAVTVASASAAVPDASTASFAVVAKASDPAVGTVSGLTLTHGSYIRVLLRVRDLADNTAVAAASAVRVDLTPPSTASASVRAIYVDPNVEVLILPYPNPVLGVAWSGFTDAESTVAAYELSLSLITGGGGSSVVLVPFTAVGLTTSASFNISALGVTRGGIVQWSVRATNGAGLVSSEVTSGQVTWDSFNTAVGSAYDGLVLGQDINYQSSGSSISANWAGFDFRVGEQNPFIAINQSIQDASSTCRAQAAVIYSNSVAQFEILTLNLTANGTHPFNATANFTSPVFFCSFNSNVTINNCTLQKVVDWCYRYNSTVQGTSLAQYLNSTAYAKAVNASLTWKHTTDVARYGVAAGACDTNTTFSAFGFVTVSANRTSWTVSNLTLTPFATYCVTVRAYSSTNAVLEARTDGVMILSVPPTAGSVSVISSSGGVLSYSGPSTNLTVAWSDFAPAIAGMRLTYSILLQRQSGSNWTSVATSATALPSDTPTSAAKVLDPLYPLLQFTLQQLSLTGGTYRAQVCAADLTGQKSCSYSANLAVVTTAPTVGNVFNGFLPNIHQQFQSGLGIVNANWQGFVDNACGISFFTFCITSMQPSASTLSGVGSGLCDVAAERNVGIGVTARLSNLIMHDNQTIWLRVCAVNRAGLSSCAASPSILVSITPPAVRLVFTGPVEGASGLLTAADTTLRYVNTTNGLRSFFSLLQGAPNPLSDLAFAVGTTRFGAQVVPYTTLFLNDTLANAIPRAMNSLSIPLTTYTTYYVSVWERSPAGIALASSSWGCRLDSSPPETSTPITHVRAATVTSGNVAVEQTSTGTAGLVLGSNAQSSTTDLRFSWSSFSDADSGILREEYAVAALGSGANCRATMNANIQPWSTWSDTGAGRDVQLSGLSLVAQSVYCILVRATNGAGSTTTLTLSVRIDAQLPVAAPTSADTMQFALQADPGLRIDTNPNSQLDFCQTSLTSFNLRWAPSTSWSGIRYYEVRIVEVNTGVVLSGGWQNTGLVTHMSLGGLNLQDHSMYTITMRTWGNNGVYSDKIFNVYVDATAPVARTTECTAGVDPNLCPAGATDYFAIIDGGDSRYYSQWLNFPNRLVSTWGNVFGKDAHSVAVSVGLTPLGSQIIRRMALPTDPTTHLAVNKMNVTQDGLVVGARYYTSVIGSTCSGLTSTVTSIGIVYDPFPATNGLLSVAPRLDSLDSVIERGAVARPGFNFFIPSTSTLAVKWHDYLPPVSGIETMKVELFDLQEQNTLLQKLATVVVPYSGMNATFSRLTLKHTFSYRVQVTSTSYAGISASQSIVFVIDASAPVPPTVFVAKDLTDLYTPFRDPTSSIQCQSSLNTLQFGYNDAVEPETFVTQYRWCLASMTTPPNLCDLVPAQSTFFTHQLEFANLTLSTASTVYVVIWSTNVVNLTSFGFSPPVIISTAAPIPGNVRMGLSTTVHQNYSTTRTVACNWDPFIVLTGEGPVSYYEYSIGSSADGEQVIPWTKVGVATQATFLLPPSPLAEPGETFYCQIRATSCSGVQSSATSDGMLFDDSAPVPQDGSFVRMLGKSTAAPPTTAGDNWHTPYDLQFSFSSMQDDQSGVVAYMYYLGTCPTCTDVLPPVAWYTDDSVHPEPFTPFPMIPGLMPTLTQDLNLPPAGMGNNSLAAHYVSLTLSEAGITSSLYIEVNITNLNLTATLPVPFTYFYVNVRVLNGVGLYTQQSVRVVLDSKRPRAPAMTPAPVRFMRDINHNEAGAAVRCQTATDMLFATWSGFSALSGVYWYEWVLQPVVPGMIAFNGSYSSKDADAVVIAAGQPALYWQPLGAVTEYAFNLTALQQAPLEEGGGYQLGIRATGKSGHQMTAWSLVLILGSLVPTNTTEMKVGTDLGMNAAYSADANELWLQLPIFTATTDSVTLDLSQISHLDLSQSWSLCIGTSPGGRQLQDWRSFTPHTFNQTSNVFNYTIAVPWPTVFMPTVDGFTFYVTVRVCSCSLVCGFAVSAGTVLDLTVPFPVSAPAFPAYRKLQVDASGSRLPAIGPVYATAVLQDEMVLSFTTNDLKAATLLPVLVPPVDALPFDPSTQKADDNQNTTIVTITPPAASNPIVTYWRTASSLLLSFAAFTDDISGVSLYEVCLSSDVTVLTTRPLHCDVLDWFSVATPWDEDDASVSGDADAIRKRAANMRLDPTQQTKITLSGFTLLHNTNYYALLRVSNAAGLSTVYATSVLVDLTAPVAGILSDGSLDSGDDIDCQSSYTLAASFTACTDAESSIIAYEWGASTATTKGIDALDILPLRAVSPLRATESGVKAETVIHNGRNILHVNATIDATTAAAAELSQGSVVYVALRCWNNALSSTVSWSNGVLLTRNFDGSASLCNTDTMCVA